MELNSTMLGSIIIVVIINYLFFVVVVNLLVVVVVVSCYTYLYPFNITVSQLMGGKTMTLYLF